MRPQSDLATESVAAAEEWKPLLDGALRAQAIERAGEIAIALRDWLPRNPEHSRTSLAGGGMGAAFFFRAYADVDASGDWRALAVDFVERGIAAGWDLLTPSLFAGVAGAAWTVHTLGPALGFPRSGALFEEVDERLARHVARAPWRQD